MSADSDGEIDDSATAEVADEEWENRRVVTVFEQTKESNGREVGDRFVMLGRHNRLFKMVGQGEGRTFVPSAVPLAHIELHQELEEDDLTDWLNSDAGKLLMEPFFDALEPPTVLTEWGEEKLDEVGGSA